MHSRFLPTGDKIVVPQTHEEYGQLFEQEIFRSKQKQQKIYNEQLEIIMQQVDKADTLLTQCLQQARIGIFQSKSIDQNLISELKKLKLDLKIDVNYPESIEPLNETLLWIKASFHLFTLSNQINLLRQLISTPISQDFIRRIKGYLEDWELILKEHKSIEGMSPFSFKQQKQPHLKCAKEFDDLLLRSLKVVKNIKVYATLTLQLAMNYTDFEFLLVGEVTISQELIELLQQVVKFYEADHFKPIEQAIQEIPNNQIFLNQLQQIKQIFSDFRESIQLSDFEQLNQIFQSYITHQQQPIYSIEQLKIDLIFILDEEEDFEFICKSFKRVCAQSIIDLGQYEDLVSQLLKYFETNRDKRIGKLSNQEVFQQFIQKDQKNWHLFLKQSVSLCTDYLRDFEKKQIQEKTAYLREIEKLKGTLTEKGYNTDNLNAIIEKLIDLFNTNLK